MADAREDNMPVTCACGHAMADHYASDGRCGPCECQRFTPRAPHHDAPPCPRCHLLVGTPIKEAEVDRFDGPAASTLYCPACGHGWAGSDVDLAQARTSWAAYEAKLAAEEKQFPRSAP